MLQPNQVIKEYRITEKAADLTEKLNKYTFEIFPNVNRIEVARAVEKLFGVEVAKVNILNQVGKARRSRSGRGQPGRTSDIKKAIVTLKEGHAIELV